ncbi:MAG: SdpI family protein [Dehalococcoidia bacterium]|nr:SdpI family protein [Dehalococcoidia bacterium]
MMFVSCMIIPLLMLLVGLYFSNNKQGKINHLFGYRTGMSMKNRDTWEFAHELFGTIWKWVGMILLPASVVAMLFTLGKDIEFTAYFGLAVLTVQLVVLVLTIVPIERALRSTFDKNGKRK